MEPDSLLVRGLVDNPSRGLSPALDRSTTFDARARAATRPTAAVTRPSPPRPRRCSAPSRSRGDALRERHDGLDVRLPDGARAGQGARHPDQRLLRGRAARLARCSARFGVEVRRYDLRDADGFRRACEGATLGGRRDAVQPVARASPTSPRPPRPRMPAARSCAATTRSRTPLLQRPLDLGADLAWQSATKYLAGHSDLLAGVVTTRDRELRERLVCVRRTIGGVLAPDPAWLLLRGLRTLHVRLPRQVATARRAGAPPRGASRRAGRALPGAARSPRIRARPPADAGRRRRRAGVRARRRARRPSTARTRCAWCATRPASAASRR